MIQFMKTTDAWRKMKLLFCLLLAGFCTVSCGTEDPQTEIQETAADAAGETAEEPEVFDPEVMKDPEKAAVLNEIFNVKHELRVDEDGNFKVLILSDVQFPQAKLNEETKKNIKTIVEREMPDLVIFNGDNSYSITTPVRLETYITNMTASVEALGIPWCHTYGNHDAEAPALSREEQQVIYEGFEYCVSKAGEEDLYGVGNFVLPVFEHDSERIAFNIWCLDSGTTNMAAAIPHVKSTDGLNEFYGHYERMEENQVEWYTETSKLLEEYNGAKVPGMMAFHIPLQETYYAWASRIEDNLEWTGDKRENVNASAKNVGLFDAVTERGDILAIVNSHEHINDFMVKYKGVRLCYTACIGNYQYHALDMLGGRVVNFNLNHPDDVETYMSYVHERVELDPEAPILDLIIEADGTVRNGAEGGPELVSHDYSGSRKTVETDEELGCPVITFTGGSARPSVYNLSAMHMDPLFSDGFSYEVVFKISDADFPDSYVGIFDYEELGGWGLDLYKNESDLKKPTLKAEVGTGSSYHSISRTVDVGKWYHCVYVYDGKNASLYLNGEQSASESTGGTYRTPSFTNAAGPYICVGGCSQSRHNNADSTGIGGFEGSIAVCRLIPTVLPQTEAEALYDTWAGE